MWVQNGHIYYTIVICSGLPSERALDVLAAQPDFKVIKKRIEDLIAREYLERDKDNANLFRYLA